MKILDQTEAHNTRSGQAIVEFAIVAFVLTFLLGAMLALGFLFFSANIVQQAADVGAMELARLPLPPVVEFPELGDTGRSSTNPNGGTTSPGAVNLFANEDFRTEIFDEKYLVCEIGGSSDEDLPEDYSRGDYYDLQGRMPLINRLLFPLYIHDIEQNCLRYPGALVENTSTEELTVLIPRVTSRDQTVTTPIMDSTTGQETGIEWYAVIEEIRDSSSNGPLSLAGNPVTGLDRGLVALRINYPYQSGALVAYQYQLPDDSFSGSSIDALDSSAEGGEILNHPVTAIDPDGFAPPGAYELVVDANSIGGTPRSHSGRFGLGHLEAFGKKVRPYRKVLSSQAIYRREVFAP